MITIKNLSKSYKIYGRRRDRLKEWLSFGARKYHETFWALRDINLEIPRGCVFGLIGMNGAGKSTLLKILTGTAFPTGGQFTTNGKVAALLELGTGFHPELSGKENVLINGRLLGLSQAELRDRLDQIADFSELGDFFEKPVRTYSSGMYVRLAFALAAAVRPDVLIVDEALSVGDAYFQQKCFRRLQEFKKQGVTILFVSHDPAIVTKLCDQVGLMNHGVIEFVGSPVEALELYNALLAQHTGSGNREYLIEKDAISGALRSGNKKAVVQKVSLVGDDNLPLETIVAGTPVKIQVDVTFNETLANPTIGFLIRDRFGYDIFGTNSAHLNACTGEFARQTSHRFVFALPLNLGPGSYTVSAAIHSEFDHINDCYEWADRVLTFQVLACPDYGFVGVALIKPTFSSFNLLK